MGIPIVSDIYDIFNTERNFNFQKEKYEYDKELQNKIFEREDSSLQRRVADAEAAGLNPQLALGSGAGTGSVVSTTAPQHEAPKLDFLSDAIALEKGIKELELLNSEKVGRDKQNSLLSLQEKREENDINYYTSRGLPTNANGQYVQMLQALDSIVNTLKGDDPKGAVGIVKGWIKNQEKRDKAPADNDLPFDDEYTLSDSLDKVKKAPDNFISWAKGKLNAVKEWRKKRMAAYDKKKKNIFGN